MEFEIGGNFQTVSWPWDVEFEADIVMESCSRLRKEGFEVKRKLVN